MKSKGLYILLACAQTMSRVVVNFFSCLIVWTLQQLERHTATTTKNPQRQQRQ